MINSFVRKTFIFLSIPLIVFFVGLLLPATPKARQSLLTSKPMKDSLLINVKGPRIIFIAGSSMTLGLNGQVFVDSLHLNPINTAINGQIGLFYLLDNIRKYIQPGDIVVVSTEYHQFYGDFSDGNIELLRVIFDNSEPLEYLKLRKKQILKTYPHIPSYSMSKFLPNQYFNLKERDNYYTKDAFNAYGDGVLHWGLTYDRPIDIFKSIEGGYFRHDLVDAIVKFNEFVKSKGAVMYISFPPFEDTSFDNCKDQIHYLERELRRHKLPILGTPERFKMTDDMIFDTAYHLNKKGVDRRTELLRQDIAAAMNAGKKI